MELTLEAKSMDAIIWWIDASYGVHQDSKVHFVEIMMFGKGTAYSKSSKHRINSRRSTESIIIGVDDHMPGILWTLRLLWG